MKLKSAMFTIKNTALPTAPMGYAVITLNHDGKPLLTDADWDSFFIRAKQDGVKFPQA